VVAGRLEQVGDHALHTLDRSALFWTMEVSRSGNASPASTCKPMRTVLLRDDGKWHRMQAHCPNSRSSVCRKAFGLSFGSSMTGALPMLLELSIGCHCSAWHRESSVRDRCETAVGMAPHDATAAPILAQIGRPERPRRLAGVPQVAHVSEATRRPEARLSLSSALF
jgi:hypothetical protein